MRYRLNGHLIKSENAAKPTSQASRFLCDYIRHLPKAEQVLDIGCGKLRYLEPMTRSSESITLLDSEAQLSRTQKLGTHGVSSIRSVFCFSNSVDVVNWKQLLSSNRTFDRVYLLNVLSIIPKHATRLEIIRRIKAVSAQKSELIIVTHFRNAEYDKLELRNDAYRYGDGHIVLSSRGASFFAKLSPSYIEEIAVAAGFTSTNAIRINGSIYQSFINA